MPRISSRRRQRGRSAADIPVVRPSTRRKIPAYELLDEASLVSLEQHAEWLLTEIGVEIRGDAEALRLFKEAGVSADGERLRFDPGHVRALCSTAPENYTMHARNPQRNIEFGGDNLILGPAYGSPFVTDLKNGRRYGTV